MPWFCFSLVAWELCIFLSCLLFRVRSRYARSNPGWGALWIPRLFGYPLQQSSYSLLDIDRSIACLGPVQQSCIADKREEREKKKRCGANIEDFFSKVNNIHGILLRGQAGCSTWKGEGLSPITQIFSARGNRSSSSSNWHFEKLGANKPFYHHKNRGPGKPNTARRFFKLCPGFGVTFTNRQFAKPFGEWMHNYLTTMRATQHNTLPKSRKGLADHSPRHAHPPPKKK